MLAKKIALVIPGLAAGGAERVMSILANEFSKQMDIQVHLILYVKPNIFYQLNEVVIIHKLEFDYKKLPRFLYTAKIYSYVRKKLKDIQPDALLSFSGKYNSLVLLAAVGLGIRSYVSDRSRPGIKYGFIPDLLNPYIYKLALGIIAQTNAAKEYAYTKTKHKNIKVIPNPVPPVKAINIERENIILNVGRFITTKNQEELIKIFIDINPKDWKLILIGEGPKLNHCKEIVKRAGFSDKVQFIGNTSDVQSYYQRSKIFAFTSTSEGFPNALAEAMAAGCACISYDCLAGPADLIVDDETGYLVKNFDNQNFFKKVRLLMTQESLLNTFKANSIKRMTGFTPEYICQEYYKFFFSN